MMNRAEFMRQLESLLQNVAPAEREEALQYYNDYFDDAGAESEQDVIEALGNPARVAENIKRDLLGNGYGETQPRKALASDRVLTEYGKEEQEQNAGTGGAGTNAHTGRTDSYQNWNYSGTGSTYTKKGMPVWAIAMLATVAVMSILFLIGGALSWVKTAWQMNVAAMDDAGFWERGDLVLNAVEPVEVVWPGGVMEVTDTGTGKYFVGQPLGSGYESITNLDIRLDGCDFETRVSEDERFYLEVENAIGFQSYVSGATLYVEADMADLKSLSAGTSKVILYMPKGSGFESVWMEIGAGRAVLPQLCATVATVSIGAGEVILDGGRIQDLTLTMGAGRMRLSGMTIGTLNADVNMGELVVDGELLGDYASVECNMGNVEMNLKGREEDFQFLLGASMGNIKLGGRNYAGLSQEQYIGEGRETDRFMEIGCSMGNVTITFKN